VVERLVHNLVQVTLFSAFIFMRRKKKKPRMELEPYEFKKVNLETDRRWTFTDRMVLFAGLIFTSACNLAIFASTFTIANVNNSPMYTATLVCLRYLIIVLIALTLVLTVFLMVQPKSSYRFLWCFRKTDPEDIMDDYMDRNILSDKAEYKTPKHASLLWIEEHPVPPPTITYEEFREQIEELNNLLQEREEEWRFGLVSR
jgi:hypothetical protein